MTNCDAPVFHGRVDRTCAKRVQSNRSQHSQSRGPCGPREDAEEVRVVHVAPGLDVHLARVLGDLLVTRLDLARALPPVRVGRCVRVVVDLNRDARAVAQEARGLGGASLAVAEDSLLQLDPRRGERRGGLPRNPRVEAPRGERIGVDPAPQALLPPLVGRGLPAVRVDGPRPPGSLYARREIGIELDHALVSTAGPGVLSPTLGARALRPPRRALNNVVKRR